MSAAPATRFDVAAWILAGIALVGILALHLLPALIAGLLVYALTHILAPRLKIVRISQARAKLAAVGVLAVLVATAVTAATLGLLAFFRSDAGSLPGLLQKMADIVESSRAMLPAWIVDSLPEDATAVKDAIAKWLRSHAGELPTVGRETGRVLAHILVGMVIGALVALSEARANEAHGPLARALDRPRRPPRQRVPAHRVRAGADLGAEHRAHRALPRGRAAAARHQPAARSRR